MDANRFFRRKVPWNSSFPLTKSSEYGVYQMRVPKMFCVTLQYMCVCMCWNWRARRAWLLSFFQFTSFFWTRKLPQWKEFLCFPLFSQATFINIMCKWEHFSLDMRWLVVPPMRQVFSISRYIWEVFVTSFFMITLHYITDTFIYRTFCFVIIRTNATTTNPLLFPFSFRFSLNTRHPY